MKTQATPTPPPRWKTLTALAAALILPGLPAGAQTITNPSFETDTFGVFPGYVSGNAPITGWAASPASRVGLNPAAGTPFANNGTIPDGTKVAFLQSNPPAGDTFLTTDITGLTAGTKYKVNFRMNARSGQTPWLKVWTAAVGDASRAPLSTPVAMRVSAVNAANPYRFAAYEFTASDVQQTLVLNNFTNAGDHTVVVDNFTIAPSSGKWSYSAWTGDADSGVDSTYPYSHAYTLGNGAVSTTVNGVNFIQKTGGNPVVNGRFAITGLGSAFGDVTRSLTGNSNTLGKSFIFGGPNMAITLQNLKPSTEYRFTLYGVAFDLQPFARAATFSSSLDPADRLTVDLDQYNQTNGVKVEYTYTTDASGTPVTINYVQTGDGSFHTSGFSNRETTPSVPAAAWSSHAWTDDASSGVLYNHIYTHAYNFGAATGLNMNGVPFTGVGGANPTVSGQFTTTNLGGVFNTDPNTLADFGSRTLANDFVYNGFPTQLSLSGLTPGKNYVLSIYSVGWDDAPVSRRGFFQGNPGDPGMVFEQNQFGNNGGIRFDYAYTAKADGTLQIISQPLQGASIHYYGFANREADPMVGVAPVVTLNPASISVERGANVTLRAAATGSAALTYEWFHNGGATPVGTGPVFTISGITAAQQGSYVCTVSNGSGSASTTPAIVTVLDRVPGLFDTGVGTNCAVLADGQPDPHYLLLVNPDGDSLINPIVENSNAFPIVAGPWVANTATSKWIGPRFDTAGAAGLNLDGGAGPGRYVYRTTFDLTGFTLSSVVITGSWATDNVGVSVMVNDVVVPGVVNTAQFASLTTFTLNSGNSNFVAGINTLDFVVENQDAAGGYTGLRVSGLRGLGVIPPGTAPYVAVQPVDTVLTRNVASCLSLEASGSADLSYQWYKVTPGGPILIPGATLPTLSGIVTTPAEAAQIAGQYYCVVTNGTGSATSLTATVTVANNLPVTGGDGLATSVNTAASVSAAVLAANDSDGDMDTLTVTAVSAVSAQGGSVVLNAGTVTYTPAANYTGTDSFTYTVEDGWGGSTTGTVSIIVVNGVVPALHEFEILSVPGTTSLRFLGIPGGSYRLQRSSDLTSNPLTGWTDIQSLTAPSHGLLEFQDASPPNPRAYYRIVW